MKPVALALSAAAGALALAMTRRKAEPREGTDSTPPPAPPATPPPTEAPLGPERDLVPTDVPGFRRASQSEVTPEMVAAARAALALPLGSIEYKQATDGTEYAIGVEEHYHPPGVGLSPEGIHKGASVWVRPLKKVHAETFFLPDARGTKRWFFWMGFPSGRYNAYGPQHITDAEAFQLHFDLERGSFSPFYRWYWNGVQWVYDARSAPEFLASL